MTWMSSIKDVLTVIVLFSYLSRLFLVVVGGGGVGVRTYVQMYGQSRDNQILKKNLLVGASGMLWMGQWVSE